MGRFGGYEARRAAHMRQVNSEIRKAAKAAKKRSWQERKIKKRSKPKRTLRDYGADDGQA